MLLETYLKLLTINNPRVYIPVMPTITFELDEETIKRLTDLAAKAERSRSAQARILLKAALDDAGVPKKKDGNRLGLRARKIIAGVSKQ